MAEQEAQENLEKAASARSKLATKSSSPDVRSEQNLHGSVYNRKQSVHSFGNSLKPKIAVNNSFHGGSHYDQRNNSDYFIAINESKDLA